MIRPFLILFALAFATAAPAAARSGSLVPLQQALKDHGGYSNGFRLKFKTGTYRFIPKSTADVTLTIRYIGYRLADLSRAQETLALVHHAGRDGKLRAWLFDQTGLIAHGSAPYADVDAAGLMRDLNVTARAAQRSPLKIGSRVAVEGAPAPPSLSADAALARAAASVLPEAVRDTLARRNGRLLILPAKETGIMPYSALPLSEGERLVHRWAVVVLPDLQTLVDTDLVFMANQLDPSRSLVVGDPDLRHDTKWRWPALPGARQEAANAARVLNTPADRLLIGAEATRDRVIAAIDGFGEADIIYLATHAIADPVNPMEGGLVALSGKHLYGRDLRGGLFRAWAPGQPLVVLSACQTALGKTFDGGSYGIARGFVSAGAGQVVASLWNVDDAATAALMEGFVEEIALRRSAPEEALRLAQLKAFERFPKDPAAWASFTIFGIPALE